MVILYVIYIVYSKSSSYKFTLYRKIRHGFLLFNQFLNNHFIYILYTSMHHELTQFSLLGGDCLVFFPTSVFYLCLLSPLILFLFSTFLLLPFFVIPLFPLSLANKLINTCNSDIVSRRIQEIHLNFPPYYIQRLYRLCNASFSPDGPVSEEVIDKVREKLGIFPFGLAFIVIFMVNF